MVQFKGRDGMAIVVVSGLVAALLALGGCQGGDRQAILSGSNPDTGTPPGTDTDQSLSSVQPASFMPGSIVELHGHGFPADYGSIRITFARIGEPASTGIPGLAYRLTRNLISVLVPTGVTSGTVNLAVKNGARFQFLEPQLTSVGPQLIGYLVPEAPRVPGVVEGDPIRGMVPASIILYGVNVDNSVISATVEFMLNRQSAERLPDVTINPQDRGIPVPGVSDTAIRGVRVTLPEVLAPRLSEDGVVYYIRLSVRSGSLVSNSIEVPAIRAGTELGLSTTLPYPAFISGAWASQGVHGNLVELFYTVFQPVVTLKWNVILEQTADGGKTWSAVPGVQEPRTDTNDPLDFRPDLVICGTGVQKPEKAIMAGPGSTYRLFVNVPEAWPLGTFDQLVEGGQVQLRLRMGSDPTSHGESEVTLPTRIEGNSVVLHYVAVAQRAVPDTDPPELLAGGTIIEEFENKDRYLDRDKYTDLHSNGLWGVGTPGVATGADLATSVFGTSGTVLELAADAAYLFDTDIGRLYQFPAGVDQTTIDRVRSKLGTNPESDGLTLVWNEIQNPGATLGELHAASLVVPANAKLYGRGTRPFTVRLSGKAGGLGVLLDGEIIVDGLPGSEGTADAIDGSVQATRGLGGVGGPGGGQGGDGGLVRVGLLATTVGPIEATPAENGQWGGGAGQTMTYTPSPGTLTTARFKSFVYGGAGAGGGFATPGTKGREGTRTDGENNWQGTGNEWANFGAIYRVNGVGGAARGSPDLLPLMGGAGGGGGGGFLARQQKGTSDTALFGVGGGGGGGGGGVLHILANGSIEIGGKIFSRGGAGSVGRGKPLAATGVSRERGVWSGACGGGGSGGAIMIQTTESIIFKDFAELDVSGGQGGRPGTTTDPKYLNDPKYPIGGDGGRGRIRLEAGRGVNLPSSIDFGGVTPSVSDQGPTTIGPILEPVNGGTGADGPLNLEDYADLARGSTVYISAEEGSVYYYPTTGVDRVVILNARLGQRGFHFTTLSIPEGTTLRGEGSRAILIRVQGKAEIGGTLDVAGAPGGQVEVTQVSPARVVVPGQGGIGGPGGGGGGFGGYGNRVLDTSVWEIVDGQDGQLPSDLPKTEATVYVPGQDWVDREPVRVVTPGRGGLTFSPRLCGADCEGTESHGGGGGGGGGFGGDGATGADPVGELIPNGFGGTAYGNHWYAGESEIDGVLYGGSGGGGGGASTNTVGAGDATAIPGSGGGGGGGGLALTVGGDLVLAATGLVDARGGDSYRSVNTGGNAGAGSGGSILLRCNGNLVMDPGARIDARGGAANQQPSAQVPPPFSPSTLASGGAGAAGRIRIEYPGAGLSSGSTVTVLMKPEGTVPSVGTSFKGNEIVSHVWSKPIPLAGGPGDGLMMTDGTVHLEDATVQLITTSFASSIVRWNVLVDGGEAKCSPRGEPDRFFGPMEEFDVLQQVGYKPSYMRFLIAFVGSSQTQEAAEVDRVSFPWERVDYTPAPPPPP